MSFAAPGGRSAVEAFWEMMDYVGPPPPRLHEIHDVMRRLVEQDRWADAMLMAMVRDREHMKQQEAHESDQALARREAEWRRPPPGWVPRDEQQSSAARSPQRPSAPQAQRDPPPPQAVTDWREE